jgi:hypothetical protein
MHTSARSAWECGREATYRLGRGEAAAFSSSPYHDRADADKGIAAAPRPRSKQALSGLPSQAQTKSVCPEIFASDFVRTFTLL